MVLRRFAVLPAVNDAGSIRLGEERRDVWDVLTLGAWFLFFGMGLMPELAFNGIRAAASVRTSTALVNSSAILTLGFAAYLGLFAYRRCVENGLGRYLAQGKALEVGLIALVAFLELPARGSVFQSRTLVSVLLQFGDIEDRYLQAVVMFVGLSKLTAWAYLLSLVIRYHAFGNRDVFSTVPSLFPSMHRAPPDDADEPEAPPRSPGGFAPPETGDTSREDAGEDPPHAQRKVAGK